MASRLRVAARCRLAGGPGPVFPELAEGRGAVRMNVRLNLAAAAASGSLRWAGIAAATPKTLVCTSPGAVPA